MSYACCAHMPASCAANRRDQRNTEVLWNSVSFLSLPLPATTCQSLGVCVCCFFFQSRECFQKISEINSQLQTQVKGENVTADGLTSALALGCLCAFSTRLQSPALPAFLPLLTGCLRLSPLFSNSDLCLPQVTHPSLEPSR